MSVSACIMFFLFFAWSFMGMPIGHAMIASAIVYLFMTHQDLGLVASQSLNGLYGSFVLLAVPLFILAAEIMNAGKMTDRLFGFANVLSDLGLPQGALALALVGFNLGVEAGQLAIVALFLPCAFLLRETLFYRRFLVTGGSAAIAMVAALWLVERALDLRFLPVH